MNVRNEPVHDTAYVVKREPPPRMEVEVSTLKKHISFGNKFDCVQGLVRNKAKRTHTHTLFLSHTHT